MRKAAKVYEAGESVEGAKPKVVYESHKKCAPGEFGARVKESAGKGGVLGRFLASAAAAGGAGAALNATAKKRLSPPAAPAPTIAENASSRRREIDGMLKTNSANESTDVGRIFRAIPYDASVLGAIGAGIGSATAGKGKRLRGAGRGAARGAGLGIGGNLGAVAGFSAGEGLGRLVPGDQQHQNLARNLLSLTGGALGLAGGLYGGYRAGGAVADAMQGEDKQESVPAPTADSAHEFGAHVKAAFEKASDYANSRPEKQAAGGMWGKALKAVSGAMGAAPIPRVATGKVINSATGQVVSGGAKPAPSWLRHNQLVARGLDPKTGVRPGAVAPPPPPVPTAPKVTISPAEAAAGRAKMTITPDEVAAASRAKAPAGLGGVQRVSGDGTTQLLAPGSVTSAAPSWLTANRDAAATAMSKARSARPGAVPPPPPVPTAPKVTISPAEVAAARVKANSALDFGQKVAFNLNSIDWNALKTPAMGGAALGAGLGGLAGLINPGEDENGKTRGRFGAMLRGALGGGAMGGLGGAAAGHFAPGLTETLGRGVNAVRAGLDPVNYRESVYDAQGKPLPQSMRMPTNLRRLYNVSQYGYDLDPVAVLRANRAKPKYNAQTMFDANRNDVTGNAFEEALPPVGPQPQ